jgi:hypothetical protein
MEDDSIDWLLLGLVKETYVVQDSGYRQANDQAGP